MATLYRTNGTQETVTPKGQFFTLEELQDYVGGYIELIRTNDGKNMYINEEGKFDDLPFNLKATSIVTLFDGDYIVGNAIVVEPHEEEEV